MHWMWNLGWLVLVFGGSIAAGLKALQEANERRAERAQERFRLKQQVKLASVRAGAAAGERAEGREREVRRLVETHQSVIDRWAAYELDPGLILQYPLIADVREPLVAQFHRAMLTADSLRPSRAAELDTREAVVEYRDAVHALSTAFDAAEAEARRRGWIDLDDAERTRVARAQKLFATAADRGATVAERQRALARARVEIDGLIVLPRRAVAAVERRAAAEIES
ncbi:hypothetical protein [Cumulibacter manganitolerans]|uniref:hypothetical protein n=1 Tax=Cumulibacter manganitolerans TaxID=1884992 RepID=UPI0012972236|nr:hypothetical protein [Cumulibacter manganitolerans]